MPVVAIQIAPAPNVRSMEPSFLGLSGSPLRMPCEIGSSGTKHTQTADDVDDVWTGGELDHQSRLSAVEFHELHDVLRNRVCFRSDHKDRRNGRTSILTLESR